MKILTADYVLPITSPPILQGAVVIDGSRIEAVGARDETVSLYPNAEIEDHGFAAILPGLVNCHSHLEITSMRGALDGVEHDFSAWLIKLNDLRSRLSDDDIRAAAVAGAAEGACAGVTCFGDIGRYGIAGFEALKVSGLRGILFQETDFAAEDISAHEHFRNLIDKFEKLRAAETPLVTVGLSPHSPYTVSPKLLTMIAEYATQSNIKLSIHAAESDDESQLLLEGTGLFTEVYKKYSVEWTSPHCSPIEYLERLGVLATRPLLAHCVKLSKSDIEKIATSGSSIAHCPKSNAKFGHGYAPFEAFLDVGIPTGFGSDSVASNNVCDMLEESRFAVLAARNREDSTRFISPIEALETATLGGAKALGLDHLIGSLESDKQADISVISLDHHAIQPVNDIHSALVFACNARDVKLTMVAGSEVFRAA